VSEHIVTGTGIASCPTCQHYRGALTCEAFPEGIPDEIVSGMNPHTSPVKGDHALRYAPKPEHENRRTP